MKYVVMSYYRTEDNDLCLSSETEISSEKQYALDLITDLVSVLVQMNGIDEVVVRKEN